MEEHAKVAILLDFYAVAHNETAPDTDLYYNSDYTLGEIASQLNISSPGRIRRREEREEHPKEFEDKLAM